jgi:hypothetical protein
MHQCCWLLWALCVVLPASVWATPPRGEPSPADAPNPASTGSASSKAPRLRVTIAVLPGSDVSEDLQVALQRDFGEALRKNARLDMKDLDVRLAEFAQEMPFDQVELARTTLQKGKDALLSPTIKKARHRRCSRRSSDC